MECVEFSQLAAAGQVNRKHEVRQAAPLRACLEDPASAADVSASARLCAMFFVQGFSQ